MSKGENGLLLLCKAADYVENGTPWDHYYSRYQTSCISGKQHISKSSFSSSHHHHHSYHSVHSQRKITNHTRCTHNELEKSRRAHLRKCMEGLKERLNFDDDTVTRITMLTILKKASASMQALRQENHNWENKETQEKKRCNSLLKRRQTLRKRLESLEWRQKNQSQSARFQSWRERNRNASECSVATTSSEDSELDFAFPGGGMMRVLPNGRTLSTPVGGISSLSLKKPVAPGATEDTSSSSGSDSGYESPKLFRTHNTTTPAGSTVMPMSTTSDKMTVLRDRVPVLSGGCNGC